MARKSKAKTNGKAKVAGPLLGDTPVREWTRRDGERGYTTELSLMEPRAVAKASDLIDVLKDVYGWLRVAQSLSFAKADHELVEGVLFNLDVVLDAVIGALETGEMPTMEDIAGDFEPDRAERMMRALLECEGPDVEVVEALRLLIRTATRAGAAAQEVA